MAVTTAATLNLSPQHAAYLCWSQSNTATLLLGPEEQPFHLPADLLTRRSSFFHRTLDPTPSTTFKEAADRTVHLPETSVTTFEHIFIWLMSPNPQLDLNASLPLLVDIAIFATWYDLPALLHQALDCMRVRFSKREVKWSPNLLHTIYSQAEDQSLLRLFTRAALATLDRSWSAREATDQKLEPWQAVFDTHSALGSDYFTVQVKDWSIYDLSLSNTNHCRFHRHVPGTGSSSIQRSGDTCSRTLQEPFEDINTPLPPSEEKKSKQKPQAAQDPLFGTPTRTSMFGTPAQDFGFGNLPRF